MRTVTAAHAVVLSTNAHDTAVCLCKLCMFAVGTGGLGSTFDELTLNKKVCDNLGVSV
jgi:hypothetical protein